MDEQGRARLPAGYAPGSNVAQLWDVRIPEGDAAPETPRSRSEAADAAVLLELSGGRPESSGGDAAAVDSVAAQGESARTGDSTRDSSQGGLAAQLLEDSGRLTALAPGKTGSKAKARSFMDDVRNSTLSQAGAPAAPGGTRSRTSKRSEDEQIRADRQRRMEQQGLTGAGREAGWRAADRSDGSGASASEALTDGTKELSRALGARMPDAVPADTQYTAEQFTLYALRSTTSTEILGRRMRSAHVLSLGFNTASAGRTAPRCTCPYHHDAVWSCCGAVAYGHACVLIMAACLLPRRRLAAG